MVSYLGFPVAWPDGRMFGTICVLDDKANPYSQAYQELLLHFRDLLEEDLQTLAHLNEELEDQRAHLSELFARVPEAVVMLNRDLRISRINPEFTNTFGYTEEESVGRLIGDLIPPEDHQDETQRVLPRMFETEEAFVAESVRTRKDGTRVPISAICVPVPSKNGGEAAGYLICRNLTEAKLLEQEQRRHQEIQLELAHVNRVATLAELSASIAHELNQPLTGVIANCGTCLQMLTRDPRDLDGAQEALGRTLRDGNRAAEVVRRLRALFAKKEPAFEAVDLNEAVRDVIALSSAELQDSQVTLRTELDAELPAVWADRIQLQQVTLNLLKNAVDAMSTTDDRPREILITTRLGDGNFVLLSVQDAGVGIDDDNVERLFDAFYSTKGSGMGVGLAVSRSIIENHRGRLWAVSNAGPGATFTFSVPSDACTVLEGTQLPAEEEVALI
jgi:PAS domain S-box-containing protein